MYYKISVVSIFLLRMSTCGVKSDVTIVFHDTDFLKDAGMSAIPP